MPDIVFLGPKYQEEYDSKLFCADSKFISITDADTTMAHLLYHAGKFSSVKEGKRSGWNIRIPIGYNEYILGTGRKRMIIVIFNPQTSVEDWDDGFEWTGKDLTLLTKLRILEEESSHD